MSKSEAVADAAQTWAPQPHKIQPLAPITYIEAPADLPPAQFEAELVAEMMKPVDPTAPNTSCMRGPEAVDHPQHYGVVAKLPEKNASNQSGGSFETVNHPAHYGGDTTYETIKVIEAWGLDFCLGNAVKYISRAGKKSKAKELEDLKKAAWYIARRIAQLEQGAEDGFGG